MEETPVQEASTPRVSPFDPDFLIIILPFALIMDALDIILEALSWLVLPKVVGIILDLITWIVIGIWMYIRVGRTPDRKQRGVPVQEGAGGSAVKSAAQQGIQQAIKSGFRKVFARTGVAFW